MIKRSIALLLALVLVFSISFTGCKKEEKSTDATTTAAAAADGQTTTEAKKEVVTLTVFNGSPYQQPTKDNKIYKMIEEELGVKFEWEFLVGDLDQKLGVMLAGGEYPDLMDSANSTDKSIAGGAYVPLESYITDATPNLKKHYAPYMEQMKSLDGHTYVFPNYGVYQNEYVQTFYNGPAFWIQKAVLKDLGYPQIRTLDDYFAAIEAYKAKYPEIDGQPTIGFEVLSFDWRAFCLKNAPAQLLGSPNDGGVLVQDGMAKIYANTDGAKKYYQKLNEEFNKGIIQADTFVMNYDEYLARLSSGAVLGMFDQGWDFDQATASLTDQGKYERTYVPLGITYDESIPVYYKDRPALNINRGMGVTVNCKDPQVYIDLAEALLSDKWQKILTWGIEGEDYMVDENGMFYRTEEQRANFEDVNWKLANMAEALWGSMPKLQGTFDDGNACDPNQQPSEYLAKLKDIDKEILAAYGYNYYPDFLGGPAPENRADYPAWSISLEDGSDAKIADTKSSELQLKWYPQLILGPVADFDAGWQKYIDEFNSSVDTAAYEDAINAGLKARREAVGQ